MDTDRRRRPNYNLLCLVCGTRFQDRANFYSHLEKHKKQKKKELIECEYCDSHFRSNYDYECHLNRHHRCQFCDYECENIKYLNSHRIKKHDRIASSPQIGGGKKEKNLVHTPSGKYLLLMDTLKRFDIGSEDMRKMFIRWRTISVFIVK